MLKIAINGFGRIGRLSFRKIFEDILKYFSEGQPSDAAETVDRYF